jgi:iron complex outermembrane receptor protein
VSNTIGKKIYRRTDFDKHLTLRGNLVLKAIPSRLTMVIPIKKIAIDKYFNRNTVGLALNPSLLDDHLKMNCATILMRTIDFADGVLT